MFGSQGASSGGLFGSQGGGGGLFGGPPSTPAPQGLFGGGGGSQTPGAGLFGGGGGSQTPGTSMFGGGGGQQAAGGGGMFGGSSSQGGGLFGSQQGGGGGMFGGAQTPGAGSGLFGSSGTTQQSGGGLFGGGQQQSGGLFGGGGQQSTMFGGGQQAGGLFGGGGQSSSMFGGVNQQQQSWASPAYGRSATTPLGGGSLFSPGNPSMLISSSMPAAPPILIPTYPFYGFEAASSLFILPDAADLQYNRSSGERPAATREEQEQKFAEYVKTGRIPIPLKDQLEMQAKEIIRYDTVLEELGKQDDVEGNIKKLTTRTREMEQSVKTLGSDLETQRRAMTGLVRDVKETCREAEKGAHEARALLTKKPSSSKSVVGTDKALPSGFFLHLVGDLEQKLVEMDIRTEELKKVVSSKGGEEARRRMFEARLEYETILDVTQQQYKAFKQLEEAASAIHAEVDNLRKEYDAKYAASLGHLPKEFDLEEKFERDRQRRLQKKVDAAFKKASSNAATSATSAQKPLGQSGGATPSIPGALGSSQTGNLFGGQPQQQPQQTGGLFGSSQGQQQPGGLFGGAGQPQQQSGGLFGSSQTQQGGGGLFGGGQQQQSTGGGLFGGGAAGGSMFSPIPSANPGGIMAATPAPFGRQFSDGSASSFNTPATQKKRNLRG